MAATYYRDVGKSANDSLNKGFPGSAKVLVKTANTNGTSFEVTLDRRGNTTSYSVKPKFHLTKLDADCTLTMDNKTVAQLELVKKAANGVKTTFRVCPLEQAGSLGVDYAHDGKHFLSEELEYTPKGDLLWTLSAVSGSKACALGATAKFDVLNRSVLNYGGVLSCVKDKYVFAYHLAGASTGKACNNVSTFRALYNCDANTQIAAQASVNASGVSVDASSVQVHVGTVYKVDPTTTVQAKLSNQGRLDLGYKLAVSKKATVAVGGVLDLTASKFDFGSLELTVDL